MKFRAGNQGFVAWHLIPTIRCGLHESGGGFIAFTFLKFDACVSWGD